MSTASAASTAPVPAEYAAMHADLAKQLDRRS
jgi:hypothetical protein